MTTFIEYAAHIIVLVTIGILFGRSYAGKEYKRGLKDGAELQEEKDSRLVTQAVSRADTMEERYFDALQELREARKKPPAPVETPKPSVTRGPRHEYIRPTSFPDARLGNEDTTAPAAIGLVAGMALSAEAANTPCGDSGSDGGGGGGG